MSSRHRFHPSRFARFVRLRLHRAMAYGALAGLIFVAVSLDWSLTEIAGGRAGPGLSGDGRNLVQTLQVFVMVNLLPVLVLSLMMFMAGMVAGGSAAAILTAVIPRSFMTYVDGVALSATLIALGDIVHLDDGLGGFWPFLLTAVWFGASGLVWNRLPFGFTYRGQATLDLDMPHVAVLARLVPGFASGTDLADGAWRQGTAAGPGHPGVRVRYQGTDTWQFVESGPRPSLPWRAMTYRVTRPEPGHTRVEISVELKQLGPLALWEFWTRPYAADYADHIEARMTGAPDRSIYARLVRRTRRQLDRRTASQPA